MDKIVAPNYVFARELRNKDNLRAIPADKPGYYKWWAQKDNLQTVLDRLEMDFDAVKHCLEVKEGYFCVYVGVAIKESVRARLDWHVNQIHNPTNVKCGTLSTLRQTISAIVGQNMMDTVATNDFIDKLLIEYYLVDLPIKSQEAKETIGKWEKDLLNGNTLYLLNIADNHHPLAPKQALKQLRKSAKQI